MATKNITDPTGAEPLNYQSGWGSKSDPTTFERMVFPPVTSGQASAHPLPPGVRRSGRITDIEDKADYYSPDLYRNLLTYFSSCEFELDPNTDFIPVSQTKANPKIFVVGLIPPSVDVTGRLLDRSASIASATGWPDVELDFSGAKTVEFSVSSTGVSKNGITLVDPNSSPKGADLPPEFWVKFVQMCQRLRVKPEDLAAVLTTESGLSPAAQNVQNGVVIAQGFNQIIASTARCIGMPDPVWRNYATLPPEEQLSWTERSFQSDHEKGQGSNIAGCAKEQIYRKNFGGYKNPDGSSYASLAYINSYEPASDRGNFINPSYQDTAVKQNPGLASGGRIMPDATDKLVKNLPSPAVIEAIARAKAIIGSTPPPPAPNPLETPPEGTNSNWAGGGSKKAADAKAAEDKKVDTDINTSDIGRRFQANQAAEAAQTIKLLEQMRNTPPLRLLVNPKSFKISSEKICNDGNWTRNGHIVEHWGDQQDKLDASGTLAAFFAVDANSQTPNSDGSSPGLTRVARQYSESFQNFLSLYLLYKNNGYLFTSALDQPIHKSKFFNRLSLVGSIYIYYDSTLYIGSFDNFNITETDDKPYTLEYSFQFTVRATFLLDRPDLPSGART
jgi:hypothetical protein